MPDKPINVLMAFDDGWAPYAAATMASVFRFATGPVHIVVLSTGLSAENKTRLQKISTLPAQALTFIDVDPDTTKAFAAPAYWSKAAYLRLTAAELVDLNRVIYLDSDVIVKTPLDELFQQDLSGAAVAGVADIPDRLLQSIPGLNWLGLPKGEHYVNTGVLLMDLALLRSIDFFDLANAWYRDHQHLVRLVDQCVMNAVLVKKKAHIHPRWNIRQLSLPSDQFASMFCSNVSGIFHFNVAAKPWTEGADQAVYQEWSKHLPTVGYTEADYKRPAPQPDQFFLRHIEEVEKAFAAAGIKPRTSIRKYSGSG